MMDKDRAPVRLLEAVQYQIRTRLLLKQYVDSSRGPTPKAAAQIVTMNLD